MNRHIEWVLAAAIVLQLHGAHGMTCNGLDRYFFATNMRISHSPHNVPQ
jgi:hypothetical protein